MSLVNASDLLTLGTIGPDGAGIARRMFDNVGNSNADVGAVNGTGVTLTGEYTTGILKSTVIRLASVSIAMTDGGAAGSIGSLKIYDWPVAALIVFGARTSFSVTAAAGITATATVKHSLGTEAEATDDTLDSTQADIIASTDTALTGSAGTASGISTAALWTNGLGGAKDLYLNFGVADAGSTANSTLTITGTITVTWLTLASA